MGLEQPGKVGAAPTMAGGELDDLQTQPNYNSAILWNLGSQNKKQNHGTILEDSGYSNSLLWTLNTFNIFFFFSHQFCFKELILTHQEMQLRLLGDIPVLIFMHRMDCTHENILLFYFFFYQIDNQATKSVTQQLIKVSFQLLSEKSQ